MLQLIIFVLAILAIIEGSIVTFNPKWTKRITLRLIKNEKLLRTLGVVELIIGVALLIISISY